MKKIYLFFTIFCIFFISPLFVYALTYVDGYYRQDGTYVRPYYRYNSDDLKIADGNARPFFVIIQESEVEKQTLEEQKKINDKLQRQLDDAALKQKISSINADIDTFINTGCLSPISPSVPYGCATEDDYEKAKYCISRGFISGICQNMLDQCRGQINDYSMQLGEYNRKEQEYKQCLESWQKNKIESIADKAVEAEILRVQNNLFKLESICKDNYGVFSLYNSQINTCECRKNYWLFNGKCEMGWIMCINLLGSNVAAPTLKEELECSCIDGYELKEIEKDKFSCKKIENQTITPTIDDKKEYEKIKNQYEQKYGDSSVSDNQLKDKLPNLTKLIDEKKKDQVQIAPDNNQDDSKTNTGSKKIEDQPIRSFFKNISDGVSRFFSKLLWFRKK